MVELDRYSGEGYNKLPEGFEKPTTNGTIYYTPLYAEKINYNTWLTKDKSII